MGHWVRVAGLLAIPTFGIAVLALLVPALPGHAIVVGGAMSVLVFLQGAVPWRHRSWAHAAKSKPLVDFGRLLCRLNSGVIVAVSLVIVIVLGGAYTWEIAPSWLDARMDAVLRVHGVSPIPASAHTTPTDGCNLPRLAIADLSRSELSQPESDQDELVVSIYPATETIGAALGSTVVLSNGGGFALVVQLVFVFVVFVIERVAEIKG